MRVDFTAGKLPDLVPQKIASGLYRITQESLQNVAKHAKAKQLSVETGDAGSIAWCCPLQDDGIGFAPQAVKGKGGLGLVSIGERSRIMGGTLSIESKPGDGARISVRVPLSKAPDETSANSSSRRPCPAARRVFNLLKPKYAVVGTAEDGKALVKAAIRLNPDLIILDITMPLLNGIDAAREIQETSAASEISCL